MQRPACARLFEDGGEAGGAECGRRRHLGWLGKVRDAENIGLLGEGFQFVPGSVGRSGGAGSGRQHDWVLAQRSSSCEAGASRGLLSLPPRPSSVSKSLWISTFYSLQP